MYIEIASRKTQLADCYYYINGKVIDYDMQDASKYVDILNKAKKILGGVI